MYHRPLFGNAKYLLRQMCGFWKLTTGLSLCVLTASILRKNGSILHPTIEKKARLSGKDLQRLDVSHTQTLTTYHKLLVWVWAPCVGGILDKAVHLQREENKIVRSVCAIEITSHTSVSRYYKWRRSQSMQRWAWISVPAGLSRK